MSLIVELQEPCWLLMLDLSRFLDLEWALWGVLLLTEVTFWSLFELFEESFSLCSSLLKVLTLGRDLRLEGQLLRSLVMRFLVPQLDASVLERRLFDAFVEEAHQLIWVPSILNIQILVPGPILHDFLL